MSRNEGDENRPSLGQRLRRFFKWFLIFLFLLAAVFLYVSNRLNRQPTTTVEEGNQATPWPTLALPTTRAPSSNSQPPLPTSAPPISASGVCPDVRRQIPADRTTDPTAPQFLRDWAATSGCYPLDIQGTAVLLPENLYGGSWVKGDTDFGTPFDQQLGSWASHPKTLVMVENLSTGERCYALVVGTGPEASGSHGAFHFFANEALGRCLIQSNDLPANYAVQALVRLINITPDP